MREYSSHGFILSDNELITIDNQNINYRMSLDSEHCNFTKGIWVEWENYKNYCP